MCGPSGLRFPQLMHRTATHSAVLWTTRGGKAIVAATERLDLSLDEQPVSCRTLSTNIVAVRAAAYRSNNLAEMLGAIAYLQRAFPQVCPGTELPPL